ncbi:Uncharacterised protein [Klebsiella pneumoniae]|nr:Uncharacterised protein [Klebsiella pneumoniae]
MFFSNDKVDGQVALPRFTQTPVRQQLQAAQLASPQLPGVTDIAPRLGRILHLLATLLHQLTLIQRGGEPACAVGFGHQLSGNRQQVPDIGGGINALAFG